MTFVWIISISVMMIAIAINFSAYGKFWHKHNWEKYTELEATSIYSKNKVNGYILYKCNKDNCWGAKTHVYTKRIDDEGGSYAVED